MLQPLLEDLGEIDLRNIDWVIVGGESGPGARPMEEAWVQSILAQCRAHNGAFFSSNGVECANTFAGERLNATIYDELPAQLASRG